MKKPYLGTKDVADKIGLTVMRVRQLAPEIKGAFKNSSGWQIPISALKIPPLANRPKPGPKPKQNK